MPPLGVVVVHPCRDRPVGLWAVVKSCWENGSNSRGDFDRLGDGVVQRGAGAAHGLDDAGGEAVVPRETLLAWRQGASGRG